MISPKNKKKSYLSSNLNFLMSQNSIDIKNLSMAIGVPAPTISRLKQKNCNPTLSTLEPLLDFFRVDIDTLLYEDISNINLSKKRTMGDLVHIYIYDMDDLISGKKNSKVSQFIAGAGITSPNTFGVNIKGDSLAPIFPPNSLVIIDPDLKPVESDFVLCSLGENQVEAPVFRQLFIDGNDYYFKPINPNFGEMKHYEKFKIMGVVIKSIETYR